MTDVKITGRQSSWICGLSPCTSRVCYRCCWQMWTKWPGNYQGWKEEWWPEDSIEKWHVYVCKNCKSKGTAQILGNSNLEEVLIIFWSPRLQRSSSANSKNGFRSTLGPELQAWHMFSMVHFNKTIWFVVTALMFTLRKIAASIRLPFPLPFPWCAIFRHLSRSEKWPTSSYCHLSWLAYAQRPPGSLLSATWQLSPRPPLGGSRRLATGCVWWCLVGDAEWGRLFVLSMGHSHIPYEAPVSLTLQV